MSQLCFVGYREGEKTGRRRAGTESMRRVYENAFRLPYCENGCKSHYHLDPDSTSVSLLYVPPQICVLFHNDLTTKSEAFG
jgi:hypothetical protein